MRKRICVFGFSNKKERLLIEALKSRDDVEVVEWVSMKNPEIRKFGHINACTLNGFPTAPFSIELYKKVFECFSEFLFCKIRSKQMYTTNTKFYEYVDFFHVYFNFFHGILKLKKVDFVLFENIPHLGADYLLFNLAKAMGIQTVFFFQTHLPETALPCKSIENLGDVSWLPKNNDRNYELKKTFKKNLFFMNRSHNIFSRTGTFKNYYLGFVNMIKYPYDIAYRIRLSKAAKSNPDLNQKFVYFALHLQPEATTNPLGGIFADQVLAIELLSKKLPPDWKIYVKENPYQDEFRRGKRFFSQLANLKNVVLLTRDVNTYDLLEKCQFAATITGTVGWEAITGGKSVLIFGNTWYETFPGVFKYSTDLNIEDVTNFKCDFDKLRASVDNFMQRAFPVMVNPAFLAANPNVDWTANCKKFAELVSNLANSNSAI